MSWIAGLIELLAKWMCGNKSSGNGKELHTAGYQPLQEGYKPNPQPNQSGQIKPPQGGSGETPKQNNSKK